MGNRRPHLKRQKPKQPGIVLCDVCRAGAPCSDHKDYEVVQLTMTHSMSMRWDLDGRCLERINDGPEQRRPDMDFGTPNGDLLIDPWIQDAVRKGD